MGVYMCTTLVSLKTPLTTSVPELAVEQLLQVDYISSALILLHTCLHTTMYVYCICVFLLLVYLNWLWISCCRPTRLQTEDLRVCVCVCVYVPAAGP